MAKPMKSAKMFLDIVESLEDHGEVGVTEMADLLGQPPSTMHGYLDAMAEEGWIKNRGGKYRLGSRFLQAGKSFRNQLSVVRAGREELNKLAGETNVTAYLMVPEDIAGIVVARHKVNTVGRGPDLGGKIPLNGYAASLVILAHLPDDQYQTVVAAQGSELKLENRTLKEELDFIRDTGISRIQWAYGVKNIAAPILTHQHGIVGSICITAPESHIDEQYFENEAPVAVRKASNRIQVKIDHGIDGIINR
jgi:DNA-binding IclR family transcriptional regulator